MISFSIWDYFVMTNQPNNRFFDFKNEITDHALEGVITINGPESFPVVLTSGIFIYGADKNPEGDNYYSSYFELADPFKWKSNNLSFFYRYYTQNRTLGLRICYAQYWHNQ